VARDRPEETLADKALKGILETLGDTPLIELRALPKGIESRVFAKIEWFNPAGSIKDRPAANMLRGKILSGELQPNRSIVVESSSGNVAIGLAQICCYYGLRFICVVDANATARNVAILRAYQAEVEMITEPDPVTHEFLPQRLRRVREILDSLPNAFWPNQYANTLNAAAHRQTMREIAEALDGRVDHLLCAVGTGGTLTGCAQYIREQGLSTEIVAVDAVGSVLFTPPNTNGAARPHRTRLIPGHGASVRPPLLDPSLPDRVVHVSDLECIVGCRRLVLREAILAGGSSGGVMAALERVASDIPPGRTCVLIFPDGGDRYLDTIYDDAWVTRNFGEVEHLWKSDAVEVGA
jgi:N-(2-amino-2-carboxyethyl)-L-glutamate synthase